MTIEQQDKLVSYIERLKALKATVGFPIAVVVFDESFRSDIITTLNESQIVTYDIHDYHPDIVLWHLLESLQKGQIIALNIKGPIDPKLRHHIDLLYHNQMNIKLPWGEPKKTSAIPEGAKLLLLISKDHENNELTPYVLLAHRVDR